MWTGLIWTALLVGCSVAQTTPKPAEAPAENAVPAPVTQEPSGADKAADKPASNSTTAKSEPEVIDDTPKRPLSEITCYDCSYFMRGTNYEGNPACQEIFPDVKVPEAGYKTCNGTCVKQIMTQNALTAYLYVSRYCAETCEEGVQERYGNDLVTTCCNEDYCNGSNLNAASVVTVMLVSVMTAILTAKQNRV